MKQPESRNAAFVLFDNPRQLLTTKQVAEALGVKEDTVRKWIYTKELYASRIKNGQLRILAAHVEALLSPAVSDARKMPTC